jgi:hypothetical protein
MAFWAQCGQDQAVIYLTEKKLSGTFVDIGCMDPMWMSNTCTLEQEHGWRGIGVELDDSFVSRWKIRPNTKFVLNDALQVDYQALFQECNMPSNIDYLSIDLEPPNLTLECLFKIPFQNYSFNVITFETDHYREDFRHFDIQKRSRNYLSSLGYVFLQELGQDDLWVHPKFRENIKKQ